MHFLLGAILWNMSLGGMYGRMPETRLSVELWLFLGYFLLGALSRVFMCFPIYSVE